MRWVTAHNKTIQIQEKAPEAPRPLWGFAESITPHAVHELLFNPAAGHAPPLFPALLAARAALNDPAKNSTVSRTPRTLVWIDPAEEFYPPAAIGLGISPEQLYVLRPRPQDLIWSVIECLRCQGVGAVVAMMMQRPTRVEVRRLQLAAEKGGGAGVLLRPDLASAGAEIYAATTRWLVAPTPGERTIQRWNIQLVHGQGGRIGQSFILEKNRASGQTNFMPLPATLVHLPPQSAAS